MMHTAQPSAAIAVLPDGVYTGEDVYDNDCFEQREVRVKVTLSIEGEHARVDFSGSSRQTRGFKNSAWANTCSSVCTAFASFFDPDIPHSEGSFRAIELHRFQNREQDPGHLAGRFCTGVPESL